MFYLSSSFGVAFVLYLHTVEWVSDNSIVQLAQEGDASLYPMGGGLVSGQFDGEHEVGGVPRSGQGALPLRSLVERTVVHENLLHVADLDRSHLDHRHDIMQHFGIGFCQNSSWTKPKKLIWTSFIVKSEIPTCRGSNDSRPRTPRWHKHRLPGNCPCDLLSITKKYQQFSFMRWNFIFLGQLKSTWKEYVRASIGMTYFLA